MRRDFGNCTNNMNHSALERSNYSKMVVSRRNFRSIDVRKTSYSRSVTIIFGENVRTNEKKNKRGFTF